MKPEQPLRSNLRYGRKLFRSGVSGLSSGRDAQLNGQPLSDVLAQSARASLGLATLGACAGLLRYYLPARRGRIAKTVACGIVGSAIGFVAGFAWKTRDLTEGMAHSAAKQMGVVRDQHWLERHPIDYA
ncbi:MAG: hypothetical protein WA655_00670 [Candidatus Korobacteraceae bacterium]